MGDVSALERRCADLEELLARERVARRIAQDEARVNGLALRVLAREVRAPLEPALEWALMLRRELLSTSGRDHALRVVTRQIEGAVRLIDDLVVSVAAMPPRPTALALDEIVLAANVAVAPRLLERKLSCAFDLTPVSLHADPKRTERLVRRFLDTAIDLAAESSELRVTLGPNGLGCTFEPGVELPEVPIGNWETASPPDGIARPHLVGLFLLQQLAAARGARLELHAHGRTATLSLALLRGPCDKTVPFSDHELRTPLQVLTIGIELLRTRVRDSADNLPREWALERLDSLEQAVDHLSAAVERLSAAEHLGRVQSPSVTPPP